MAKDRVRINNPEGNGTPDNRKASSKIPGSSGDVDCTTGDCKEIAGEFKEIKIWCGEQASLRGWDKKNIADNAPVTFEISRKRDGLLIATVDGQLAPDECIVEWNPKKPEDHQDGDIYEISKVSSDGVSAKGKKEFTFKNKNIRKEKRDDSIKRAPGKRGRRTYDIEFKDNEILVTVKIHFKYCKGAYLHDCEVPNPKKGKPQICNHVDPEGITAGKTVGQNSTKREFVATIDEIGGTEAQLTKILAGAEAIFNDRFTVRRKSCIHTASCSCLYPVKFSFEKVEEASQAHRSINLYPVCLRANSGNFPLCEMTVIETPAPGGGSMSTIGRPPDRKIEIVWAHEIGHLLGWPDEYPGGSVMDPPEPPWCLESDDLMGSMGNDPLVRTDYGTEFAVWMTKRTGIEHVVQ